MGHICDLEVTSLCDIKSTEVTVQFVHSDVWKWCSLAWGKMKGQIFQSDLVLCENLLYRLGWCYIDKSMHWLSCICLWILDAKPKNSSIKQWLRSYTLTLCRIWECLYELDSVHLACWPSAVPCQALIVTWILIYYTDPLCYWQNVANTRFKSANR